MKIPTDILRELRYQAETKVKLTLYKRVECRFLPSLGIADYFESFQDPTYGYIGSAHFRWENDGFQADWFDTALELLQRAEEIQEAKTRLYDEGKILRAHQNFLTKILNKSLDKSPNTLYN